MKNRPFTIRVRAAIAGIKSAWRSEASFRAQLGLGGVAIAGLALLRPSLHWWAIFVVIIATTLAIELVNTALEHVVDRLHPEVHPLIRIAKDCAAGAVLIMSLGALLVLGLFLYHRFG